MRSRAATTATTTTTITTTATTTTTKQRAVDTEAEGKGCSCDYNNNVNNDCIVRRRVVRVFGQTDRVNCTGPHLNHSTTQSLANLSVSSEQEPISQTHCHLNTTDSAEFQVFDAGAAIRMLRPVSDVAYGSAKLNQSMVYLCALSAGLK